MTRLFKNGRVLITGLLYGILFSSVFLLACKKSIDKNSISLKESVYFDHDFLELSIGKECVLNVKFDDNIILRHDSKWSSSDPNVATVQKNGVYSAIVAAKNEGSTVITFQSVDGHLSAQCEVAVRKCSDGVLRILAIGNSFSEDAIEHHLWGLANVSDIKVIIGNLHVGGASLDLHLQNALDNKPDYSYRKIGLDGNKMITSEVSILDALIDEPWDYVSFQQASPNSGQYTTYINALPGLVNYVKDNLKKPCVNYVMHQTWAYAKNSDHKGFLNYGNDQMTMYKSIVSAVNQVAKEANIEIIIPSGTAIQNGRTSVIADNFDRDGQHLNVLGRYTAAATWYEILFKRSVIGNTYKPTSLSDYEKEIAQYAAHFSVNQPNDVTDMVDFKVWNNFGTDFSEILIDFNPSSSSAGWNAFTVTKPPFTLNNLKANDNIVTGTSIELVKKFGGQNTNGSTVASIEGVKIPEGVSQTSFYGIANPLSNNATIESVLKVKGLEVGRHYSFSFFASRMSVKDDRETSYTVSGLNEKTVLLKTSNNETHVATVTDIRPDSNGEIYIVITAGPNNNNKDGYYYLSALKMSLP